MASASSLAGPPPRKGDAAVSTHVRLNVALNEHLRVHAVALRDVSVNRLINDVLTLWVLTVTDPNDPRFSKRWLGVDRPGFASEPHEGYLASLCDDDAPAELVEAEL